MFLKRLSVINFKNIPGANLEFSSRVNCFVGDNGAGKTNLVDAVHYLSMCKSSLTMTDGQSVRHGCDAFLLEGEYLSDGGRIERVVCGFRRSGGKTVKRNGKEYEKLADHIGLVPVVIVSPADAFLVSDAADERRRYLNAFLSQLDRDYLTAIVKYNHVLGERNRLLKRPDWPGGEELLDVLDQQLVHWGETVSRKRRELVERLAPQVAEYYRILSDDRERIELSYHSELNDRPFAELLAAAREKDRISQFSTTGVHRDDLRMRIGGYPLKKYGSQGQQKSFLVALKLAQYRLAAAAAGEKPILLLDDLFDKLDMQRVEQLIRLVSGPEFGQIFITDCNKVRLESIFERSGEPYTLMRVEGGEPCPAEAGGRKPGEVSPENGEEGR